MRAIAVLSMLVLAGCMKVTLLGHTVTEGRQSDAKATQARQTDGAAGASAPFAAGAVREVTLTFTTTAREKVQAERGFDPEVLHRSVEAVLAGRHLLDPAGTGFAAEILIDDYTLRPTSNVVMLGATAGAGTLRGLVRLLGPDNVEQRSFSVEAEDRISIPKDGRSAVKLDGLYRRFGELMADALAAGPARQAEAPR